jgi:hypothetical protein
MPSLFFTSFNGNFKSPVAVRNWVGQNVPCLKGPVPQEWTHAIYAKLRQYGVSPAVITAGLTLARADGYVFNDDRIKVTAPKPGPINTAPTMGVPSESPSQARKHAAEVLEWQFEKAMLNHNYGEMRRLAQQFADLLNNADAGRTSEDQEMQWGAPLLRRSVTRNYDGSDPAPREGGFRTWGRGLYVPVPVMEGEGEAEERD